MENNSSLKNETTEIIIEYLKDEAHFALMLDGKWGSGKSFYINNIFKEALEKAFPKPNEKKLIYTSANGISSFEEILEQIFIKKYHLNKGIVKGVDLTFQLTKIALKSSENKKHYAELLDSFPKLWKKKDLINYSNVIIVIDDIERINFKNITIEDFLGKINKWFTENDSISVILICDEKELLNKLDDQNIKRKYEIIKEKSIFRTITFRQDIKSLLPSLINQFDFKPEIKKCLLNNLNFIYELITYAKEENIRTIIFFITNLFKFTNIIEEKKFEKISKYIILFNFICSKAFKEGKINKFDNIIKDFSHEIEIIGMKPLFSTSGRNEMDDEVDETKPYREIAINFSNYYKMFFSISEYIKTGYLDVSLLNSEIEKYLPQLNHLDEWNIKLNNFNDFRKLTNSEFNDTVKSIFNFLSQNKYDINSILKFANKYFFFYEYGIRFNSLELEEFNKFICDCLRKAIVNDNPTYLSSEEMLEKYKEKYPEAKEIFDCYADVNNMKYASYFEDSITSLKLKLIDNLKECNRNECDFLFSNTEIIEIEGLLEKYTDDSLYAEMFNSKFNNEWYFHRRDENKIDPLDNVSRFLKMLKETEIRNDNLTPYYINDLDCLIKKRKAIILDK